MTTRGIPEVPMHDMHPEMRRFLVDVRQQLINLRSAQAPLAMPTNFRATAQAFAVKLQWTRSTGADYHEVLWNTTPNLSGAFVVDVGASAEWVDVVGNVGITRYYWVRARKLTGAKSPEAGSLKAVTLGSAIGITPPVPPPPSRIIVVDERTGHRIPYALSTSHGERSIE